jgi:biopolymer transport protein ExbD
MKFSKKRLVLGILIGLATAFSIYGFMYLLRETFRLMSFSFRFLPNILSEFDRNTYNWFFASLALIFGNSVAISILFSGSTHGFGKRNYKNRRIINNQTVLNLSFAYWFAKISFVIAFFSMGISDFNFLPDFTIPIILLVLVLYLETWKTLSLCLRKNKFKWMLIHFILLFVLSFGLSKIDFIDYKTIDNNQLKFHPIVDLPISKFSNMTYFENFLNVSLDKEENDKLLFENYENHINESYLDFLDYKLSRVYDSRQSSIRLIADSNTKMKTIIAIRNQIVKAKINNIIYAILDPDELARRFSSEGIKLKIVDNNYFENNKLNQIFFYKAYFDVERDFKPKDTIKIKINKSVFINGSQVPFDKLIDEMEKYINQDTIFEYEISQETLYKDYITLLSSHLKAIEIKRKKNIKVDLEWDSKKFIYKNKVQFLEDQQCLRDEFPFRVIEKIN